MIKNHFYGENKVVCKQTTYFFSLDALKLMYICYFDGSLSFY